MTSVSIPPSSVNTTEAVVPASPFVLDQVLITGELDARPSRAPDFEAENRALSTLAEALATSPQTVLQKLAEIVLELCRAESAGISILEYNGDTPVFRWRAAAGAFSANIGGTMPRDASPCGTVIERNAVLLFDRAERHFTALRGVEPRIYENLLAPFQLDGRPAGTVWAIRHDPEGSFDREDARLLGSLARFAAAAYQTVIARERAEAARQELQRTAEARVRSAAARSEQLGKLFEAAPGFMAVVRGPEYVFELANPAYYQLVGHREIVGKTLLEALP